MKIRYSLPYGMLLGFLNLLCVQETMGMPTLLLALGEVKCFGLELVTDQVLSLDYIHPELPTDEKAKNYNTSTVDLMYMPDGTFSAGLLSGINPHLRAGPKRKYFDATRGTMHFPIEQDGTHQLCVQASRRLKVNEVTRHPPTQFISLRVVTRDEIPEEQYAVPLKEHLSHMEQEMGRIKSSLSTVMNMAHHLREKDHEMHEKFVALHATTFYWPLVQLCVLIGTGFTQASHIVSFFKKRRII